MYAPGTEYRALATSGGSAAAAASQAEAEAGTEVALRSFSPLRVGQAIAALESSAAAAASQAEAEAGTEVALRSFSPLRIGQAIAALGGGSSTVEEYTVSTTDATQTTAGSYSGSTTGVKALQANWRVIAIRDNKDFASFQWLGQVVQFDNGTLESSANNGVGAAPDFSTGTGATLSISVDGILRLRVTGNAAENWDWAVRLDYIPVST
jgi:hypothetical protein